MRAIPAFDRKCEPEPGCPGIACHGIKRGDTYTWACGEHKHLLTRPSPALELKPAGPAKPAPIGDLFGRKG